MAQAGILARTVKTKVLTDTTAAGLEAAVNLFLAALSEDTFLSLQFQAQTGAFSALITYTR